MAEKEQKERPVKEPKEKSDKKPKVRNKKDAQKKIIAHLRKQNLSDIADELTKRDARKHGKRITTRKNREAYAFGLFVTKNRKRTPVVCTIDKVTAEIKISIKG
jgi:hypothetical protein